MKTGRKLEDKNILNEIVKALEMIGRPIKNRQTLRYFLKLHLIREVLNTGRQL
jgi:hypothetical protein